MHTTASEGVILLYYSDLRDRWPERSAALWLRRLPYGKRLRITARAEEGRATLVGVALAVQALRRFAGRTIMPADISFPDGGKPRVAAGPDFSIAHSGPWVGCAVAAEGVIGLDLECERPLDARSMRVVCNEEEIERFGPRGALELWVAKEAALKACGASVSAASSVRVFDSYAVCGDRSLHRTVVDAFDGAAACIMTSRAANELEMRALRLDALFDL